MIKGWLMKIGKALWMSFRHCATDPKTIALGVGLAFGMGSMAFGEGEPLNLAATGTSIAAYITTAATAALPIFAGLFGIRVIVRAFFSVAG